MGFIIPGPSDFKAQFTRDFPYASPSFGAAFTATFVPNGAITGIVLVNGGMLYTESPSFTITDPSGTGAVINSDATVAKGTVTAAPTVAAGGNGYVEPVVVVAGGSGDNTDLSRVNDNDLAGAIQDAQFNINQCLFDTQSDFNRAFLYLAAHQLVEKMLMAVEGLASQYAWLTTSKSVGDVSESFQIPEYLAKDPFLANLSKSRYGAMYLQIILPLIVGHTMALPRWTLP